MAKSSDYLMSAKNKSSSKAFSFFICFVFFQSELIVSVCIIIRCIENVDVKNLPLITNVQVTYLYVKHRVCPEVTQHHSTNKAQLLPFFDEFSAAVCEFL